jgi:hypothetical protein
MICAASARVYVLAGAGGCVLGGAVAGGVVGCVGVGAFGWVVGG